MSSEGEPKEKKPKLETNVSVQPKLVPRKWLDIGNASSFQQRSETNDVNSSSNFRIMQFNTLADALAHTPFVKCPVDALKWNHRGPLIVQEIIRSEADIVCLEEVDHFEDFFKPKLTQLGFEGFFFPKCDSPCLAFPDNNGPDGCALFYRSAKFEFVKKKELVLKNVKGGESHQVALLAQLKMKDDKQQPSVFVAMAHFKAKTEGKELRAAQGRHLIEEATAFSGAGQPVIIAGDFNATADEEVYKFFSNLDAHPDLKLESSYGAPHYGAEPEFTSWKFRAKGEAKYTIDYIWFNPERLCVEGVWGIPEEGDIGEDALPCKGYPSDHVALCSHFSISYSPSML